MTAGAPTTTVTSATSEVQGMDMAMVGEEAVLTEEVTTAVVVTADEGARTMTPTSENGSPTRGTSRD